MTMEYSDEFIKERERYAIIGDDLDIAFVGQKKKCTFDYSIFNISNATLKIQFLISTSIEKYRAHSGCRNGLQ